MAELVSGFGGVGPIVPQADVTTLQFPRYRSHKIVRAAEIIAIEPTTAMDRWKVATPYGVVVCEAKLFARGIAQPGDFLVVYDDGYLSWSPRDPLLGGYTAVDQANVPAAEVAIASQATGQTGVSMPGPNILGPDGQPLQAPPVPPGEPQAHSAEQSPSAAA